jgi:hypothetical protein
MTWGVGIGWHRDKPHFGRIFGLSLGTTASSASGVRMVKSGDATRSRPRRAPRCLANGEESQGLQDDLAMPLFVYVSTSKGQPGVGTVLRNLQPCPESNPSLPGDRGNQPGESGGPNCLSQSTGAVSLRKRKPGFWPGESKTFRNVMKREHLRSA